LLARQFVAALNGLLGGFVGEFQSSVGDHRVVSRRIDERVGESKSDTAGPSALTRGSANPFKR
jgi:hypothetical protein